MPRDDEPVVMIKSIGPHGRAVAERLMKLMQEAAAEAIKRSAADKSSEDGDATR